MENEVKAGVFCGGGCLLLLLLLLAICWDPVEPTQYALIYNSISKNVDPTVYEGGRYFLFFTNSFLTFPKTLVSIEFSDSYNAKVRLIQISNRLQDYKLEQRKD